MADEAIDESLKAMDKIDQLSHPEVMALFSNKLAEIMKDPLLIGLPNEPTLDEVNSQIALEHGRAMIVNVRQQDELNTILPVVVIQNATVHDLKKAIQRHISLKLLREGGPNIVSW
ncbi:U11/U12 small nuclear ribonucleoprotein 25 kDa protein [Acropora cervicornis]|uniref:U11/U12 small nuclear ribonucleoprotein 25 kDa protein n=2 Tax=Acropora TaxID=6127 RepID=A0AAD9QFS6_ACRCE|nr:U11/U12 small nuclear ribonucleoprotein 25 kDa protein [Acropora cervicornis]